MKLYATTTSERASKGQGGNKYIKTVYTIDKDENNSMIVVQVVHDNGNVSFTLYQKTDSGMIERYRDVYVTGENAKKEKCKQCATYYNGICDICGHQKS